MNISTPELQPVRVKICSDGMEGVVKLNAVAAFLHFKIDTQCQGVVRKCCAKETRHLTQSPLLFRRRPQQVCLQYRASADAALPHYCRAVCGMRARRILQV